LNRALAKRIADEGEYMPAHAQWMDLQELEEAGLVELGALCHPVVATWRITRNGKEWLEKGN
jgi:hypothetical protein